MHFATRVLRKFAQYIDDEISYDPANDPLAFEESLSAVLKSAMSMVTFISNDETCNSIYLGGNRFQYEEPESEQFDVVQELQPAAGLLASFTVRSNSSKFECGIWLLYQAPSHSRNLLITNRGDVHGADAGRELLPAENKWTAGWATPRIGFKSNGLLDGLPKPLERVELGNEVFGLWYEALGNAIGITLLEYGFNLMLQDDYSWPDMLNATWRHLIDCIKVLSDGTSSYYG